MKRFIAMLNIPLQLAKHVAQQEFNNLKALFDAGVACPQPLFVTANVLVMSAVFNTFNKPGVPISVSTALKVL